LNSLCDVPGIKVGHAFNTEAKTGCTVILPETEVTAGVDVRGSAPGTREIEVLKPVRIIQKIHAVTLTGGSAFGLNAAGGVQKYLEEQHIGFETGVIKVPIVPAAVIFDLAVGDSAIRPDFDMGYRACLNASSNETSEGAVGVGCGATVAKLGGQQFASRGGVGTCSKKWGELVIGVLTVVNSLGEVIDPNSGEIIAGVKKENNPGFVESIPLMRLMSTGAFPSSNTTLSVVATNASLTKEQCTKLAQMAQNGFARAIRPAHTMYDGDIVFALSTGEKKADINYLGALACELVAESIVRAVKV